MGQLQHIGGINPPVSHLIQLWRYKNRQRTGGCACTPVKGPLPSIFWVPDSQLIVACLGRAVWSWRSCFMQGLTAWWSFPQRFSWVSSCSTPVVRCGTGGCGLRKKAFGAKLGPKVSPTWSTGQRFLTSVFMGDARDGIGDLHANHALLLPCLQASKYMLNREVYPNPALNAALWLTYLQT